MSGQSEALSPCHIGGGDVLKVTTMEGASNSDSDSTDSRDVNLNSKNFADCNLFGVVKNSVRISEFNSGDFRFKSSNYCPGKEGNFQSGNADLAKTNGDVLKDQKKPESNEGCETSVPDGIADGYLAQTSTPNSQPHDLSCGISSIDTVSPKSGEEETVGTATYIVGDGLRKVDITTLTDDEVEKKFQELALAFRTDSMTLENRLKLRKRLRDLGETNVENEIKDMQTRLDQYLCVDGNSMQLVSDMRKQLEVVMASVINLSSTAESYGYVQSEERIAAAFSVMLQHVDNIERSKSESSKSNDRLKNDGKRSQFSTLEDSFDERLPRRRSVAVDSINSVSRRRASIASLPRAVSNASDNAGNSSVPFQSIAVSRSAGAIPKQVLSSQSPTRVYGNPLATGDHSFLRRDTVTILRYRKDNRTSENTMEHIEEFPERQSIAGADSIPCKEEEVQPIADADESNRLLMHRLSGSIDDSRSNSASLETISVLSCLRRLVECNIILLSEARLRWPDNVRHYIPFVMTWYVIVVIALFFAGGLFLGLNGCSAYSHILNPSLIWCGIVAVAVINVTRCLVLSRAVIGLLTITIGYFSLSFLRSLRDEEFEGLLKNLGIVLEVRYPQGPPPI